MIRFVRFLEEKLEKKFFNLQRRKLMKKSTNKRRIKSVFKVLFILQFVFVYVLGGVPWSTVFAGSQFLMWNEEGSTFASFGPNSIIRIHTGQIEFVKGCAKDGADDFINPFADIYVVPSGKGAPGEKLEDVSGSPNTVQGAHGGLFISEIIGITAPGGKLGPGTYTVVYDECQDGTVSPEDKVFPNAFEVVFPTDMPDIMADPAIHVIKEKAGEARDEWESIHSAYKGLFEMQAVLGTVGKAWQCGGIKELAFSVGTNFQLSVICPSLPGKYSPGTSSWDIKNGALIDGFFSGLTMGVERMTGVNPKQLALKQILATASHYRGIHADPPNPDFQKLTPLELREEIDTESNDPLTIAIASLGNELGNEAPLLKSFLTSIERYQGSALGQDGEWSLIHARAVQDYSIQLSKQITRTNKAIEMAKQLLEADPREFEQTALELQAFRDEVATQGLSLELVRNLKHLGFTDSEIEEMKKQFLARGFTFNKQELLNHLDSLRMTNEGLITSFGQLAKNMKEHWLEYLSVMPNVGDYAPIVNAGGPYEGQEGSTIHLDGSASTSPSEIVNYEWDLDGDGAFDDAEGAKPSFVYNHNINKLVGLKVTNLEGWSNIGYATVFIENSNMGPTITAITPQLAEREVIVGENTLFTVDVTDPEGDQVNIDWYVDSKLVESGLQFTFAPTDEQIGKHDIEAIVYDSSGHSGYESISWPVSVLTPDDDGDGWRNNADCERNDPDVHPGASEKPGNGKDDDCNPETSDSSTAPTAKFYPMGYGKNVALYEAGAKVEDFSSQWDSSHSPKDMLDTNINSNPWATTSKSNQWVKISLAEGKTYLIDRIQVMPRPGFPGQRVKDFEVAVSTTTLDNDAFTTVLQATAENNGNLQEFKLSEPVLAKYVMYRPLNSQGGEQVISTQQFKVKTGLVSTPIVTFENVSTDLENDIVSWEWNFGDDTPINVEKNPTHEYAVAGTYMVTLKATDADGNSNTYSLEQTVQSADFSFLPEAPKEGEYVTFYNTSIGIDEAQIVSSTWKFDDGSPLITTTSSSYSHIYRDNKPYTVTLETLDKSGKKRQVSKVITPVNVPPTVNVGRDITVRSEQKINFTPSIYDPGLDAKTCNWDFGDGTSSDVCNSSHTYPALVKDAPDQDYTATITVTDDDGGVSTDSMVITVRAERDPKLVALYTFDNDFKDYSGNKNDGTPVGNMTFVDGIKGKAAYFDGRSGIKVKDSDSLDLSTAFSFSMWLYKEDRGAGGWAPILSKGDTTDYGPYALLHDYSGVSPGVRLTGGATSSPDHLFTSVKTNLKEWYLFTTTWDGNHVKFYVNDILVDTQPWKNVFKNDSSQLLIGYDPPGVTEYYQGLMDDFRAYNYSLSPEEISDLVNDRLPEDKEPPVTTAVVTPSEPNGSNGWYNQEATVTLTAIDEDSDVEETEYRINGGAWQVYGGIIPFEEDGTYTVDYFSTDKAGNIEEMKSLALKVDQTKPNTKADVVPSDPTGANSWYTENVSFTLSAIDETSGIEKIEYRLNEGEWRVYENSVLLNIDGVHSVEYRSMDLAGNVEEMKFLTVKIDKTKPVTKAEAGPDRPDGTNLWYTKDVILSLSALDETSGIEKIEYRINDGEWMVYEKSILINTNGIYTIEYRSIDQAGNVEDRKTVTMKVDKSAPTTTSKVMQGEPNGVNGWYTKDLTVELAATDSESGVATTEYRIDGNEWVVYQTPLQFTEDGIYLIEYRSTDQAGNTESIQSITVKIDKSLPDVKLTLNQNTLWPPNHKMVTVKVTPEINDSTSGIQSIILTSITSSDLEDGLGDGQTDADIQKAEIGTADFEFELRAERSGKTGERIYTITYTITDLAGNVRTEVITITVSHDQARK
jgi:PKD repeat protein